MLYFAGGYPGLYFPPSMVVVPPSTIALEELEIPMRVITSRETHGLAIQGTTTRPMAVVTRVEVPMRHGLASRAEIPMRVITHALTDATPVVFELPMHLASGDTTAPATIHETTTRPMQIAPAVEIAAERVSESVEIPMRIRTTATMERA